MFNEPSQKQLKEIPRLYETEHTSLSDKLIHLHFFIGDCDWYISEYDGEDLFWGFVILNDDFVNAEWGYISYDELKRIKIAGCFEVENDLHWNIRKAVDVEKINACHF